MPKKKSSKWGLKASKRADEGPRSKHRQKPGKVTLSLLKPRKRRKLGEEEDEWCDALSDLNVNSDDEYFDAKEQIESSEGFLFSTTSGFTEDRKRKRNDAKGLPPKGSMDWQLSHVPSQLSTSGIKTASGSHDQDSCQGSSYQSSIPRGSTTAAPESLPPRWPVGEFDEILRKVADEMSDNKVSTLGLRLGFTYLDIVKYDKRYKSGKDKSTGTLKMLRDWRKQQLESNEYDALRKALIQSGNIRLADQLLPIKEKTKPQTHVRPVEQSTGSVPPSNLSGKDFDDILRIVSNQIVRDADISSLGKALGFTSSDISRYRSRMRSDVASTGTMQMLRDWRKKQTHTTEYEALRAALNKAGLAHLVPLFNVPAGREDHRARKITITLMTSSQLYTIEGLEKKFHEFKHSRSDLIEEVRVLQLPYSRIQYYTFTEPVDVMILCHSIDNRRFAITNVTDSLYDAFLDYCNKKLGKERIVVIAHDFPPEEEKVRKTKMDTFKHTQWSTFENAGLVMICGMMDKKPEMKEQDWDSLVKFLEAASRSNPDKADTSPTPPAEKHTQPSPSKPSKSETANKKNGKSSRMLPGPGKAIAMRFRKPVIYVCTSWGLNSVRGFKEHFQALIKRSFLGCEIREQELPYSRLKDFKFPSEVDKRDAMILCHSVQNRGFSVTDVPNSIYDEYLTYCKRLFGKDHVAVIVHDFEYSPDILKVHIDTFRRGQPTTFELAQFIALAGKLDVPDVHLVHDGSQSLETFVKGLR